MLLSLPHHLNGRHNLVNGLAKKVISGVSVDRLDFNSQYHDVEKVMDMQPTTTPPGRHGRKPVAALCKCVDFLGPVVPGPRTTDLSTNL